VASTAALARPLDAFRPDSLALATVGLSLGTFMQVLDMTIANVSLPTIAGNLGASLDQSTWVITSFTVCQAITLPMTGFLSRRFGEVKIFVGCVLLFSIFSLLCGFATSLTTLVLFRALQGAVCGPMYPITQSLMVEIYPRDKRGVALSIISMITVVAPIIGPVLGGWITDSYSWRWIFFINVPLGVIAAALVLMQLGERAERLTRDRIDWVGVFTLVIGVGSLQILLDKGNDLDWFGSNLIIALAAIAAVALSIWVVWELTDESPLVDLRLFRHRNFAAGTLALTLGFAAFFSIPLLLPQWLQSVLGYDALWSGLAAAPVGIIPFATVYLVGRYAALVDMRWLSTISFAVMGLVCFRFGQFNSEVNFAAIAFAEFVFGAGIALFFLPVLTILLSELEGPEIAEGSGSATFLRTVGASFAVSIVTYMWTRGGAENHAILAEHINPFNPSVQQGAIAAGGHLQHYAAVVNGVITQQSMQISFNHVMDGLGVVCFLLMAVVWLAKPPFVAGGRGGH
jgi:DHA2 family multidrug resistance protein